MSRYLPVLLLLAACGGSSSPTSPPPPPPPPPPTVARVLVQPDTATLLPQQVLTLVATPQDAQGATVPGKTVAWSTSAAAVATVGSTGVVTAVGAGSASVTATVDGRSGSSVITVVVPPPTVQQVTLAPDTATLVPAQAVTLVATPRDSAGNPLASRPVTWSTSDAAVATVSGGVVTGVSVGTATITAAVETRQAAAMITVKEGGVVPAAGGTVATVDGRARVVFPAGALSSTQAIAIAPIGNPVASPRLVPGTAFEFGPSQTFAQPVTMSLGYLPSALPAGVAAETLRLHRLENGAWVEVPGSIVDTAAHRVTGLTSSFSSYGIAGIGTLGAVTVTFQTQTPLISCSVDGPWCQVTAQQMWVVPEDVYQLSVELFGASGGGSAGRGLGRGLGGKTSATFDVYPGETLEVRLGRAGNQAAVGSGGGGLASRAWFCLDPCTFLTQTGRAGGGATDIRRGPTPHSAPGAPGRLAVAGGGGGDGGPTIIQVGEVGGNPVYGFGPAAPGGDGGGLAGQPGGSGNGFTVGDVGYSGALGGGGGSSLEAGLGGLGARGPVGARTGKDGKRGDCYFGGGAGASVDEGETTTLVGAAGGGGGGGWCPGGGGGGSVTHEMMGGGGGGGSSYGPLGSAFFQGVHQGDGKAILTFTRSPGLIPTVTDVTLGSTSVKTGATLHIAALVAVKPPATGTITGTVRFELDGIDVGPGPVLLEGGAAAVDAPIALPPGQHIIVVRYSGAGTLAPSAKSVAVNVTP